MKVIYTGKPARPCSFTVFLTTPFYIKPHMFTNFMKIDIVNLTEYFEHVSIVSLKHYNTCLDNVIHDKRILV